MGNDIIHYLKKRRAVKAFDSSKTIPPEIVEKLKELLRWPASSMNFQPWHFVMASTPEGKARVAKAFDGNFSMNQQRVNDASHVVIFAARDYPDNAFLTEILEQEDSDGRYANEEVKAKVAGGREMVVNAHENIVKDMRPWLEKQVYINLGNFLLGASALGLDACPMEGFDTQIFDSEFGLTEKGMHSLAVVIVGYADDENDFNATLPKSRLPLDMILEEV